MTGRAFCKKTLAVALSGALTSPTFVFAQDQSVTVNQGLDGLSGSATAGMSDVQLAKLRFARMVRTNPDITTSQINVNATAYVKDAAQAAFYPKVSIGANASSSTTVNNVQSTGITVLQPIYTGGRLTARAKSAEQQGVIANGDFDKTVQDVVTESFIASNNLSRNALLVEASKAAESAVAELLALERRRVDLGGGGVTDEQFAKARLAVTQDRLVNYQGQLDEARATYARYFGAYPDPLTVPELDVTRDMLPPTMEEAINKALFASPEVRLGEYQISKARYDYDAEDASLWPSVDLVGIQQFYQQPDIYTGKTQNSSVNLRLSYSAFSGGDQIARVRQAQATIQTRRAQLESTRIRVQENVRFQWGKYMAGVGRSNTLSGAYKEALQVFKNRKRLRDFGRETVIVMLDSEVEYFNVLIAYINSVFDAREAGFRLLRAMGQMMPTPHQEGDWISPFFAKVPERAKLQDNLRATADIASSPADDNIARQLGIAVDQADIQNASRFVLTPSQRLSVTRKAENERILNSESERSVRPALKTDTKLDKDFY
ncbi:TolC family protein [Limnobacter sp.]|uniref:TolC family protein n=1 Tax=Limnobacter sp. TaxID=2003368 RepID=UPI00258E4177|nr:TolC family protein [Limnobacter sp.]